MSVAQAAAWLLGRPGCGQACLPGDRQVAEGSPDCQAAWLPLRSSVCWYALGQDVGLLEDKCHLLLSALPAI